MTSRIEPLQSESVNDSIKTGVIDDVSENSTDNQPHQSQQGSGPKTVTSQQRDSQKHVAVKTSSDNKPSTPQQGSGQNQETQQQESDKKPKVKKCRVRKIPKVDTHPEVQAGGSPNIQSEQNEPKLANDDEVICSKRKLVKAGWIFYFAYCTLFSVFGLVIFYDPVGEFVKSKDDHFDGSGDCRTATALLVCVVGTFGGVLVSFFCPFVMKKNALCGFLGLTFGMICTIACNIAAFVVSEGDAEWNKYPACSAWALAYIYAGGGMNIIVCCLTYAVVAYKYCSKHIFKPSNFEV